MAKTNLIAFRATPEQRRKLELLARGEGTTISGVLTRLVDAQPVQPVRVVRDGLAMSTNSNTGAIRQDAAGVVSE